MDYHYGYEKPRRWSSHIIEGLLVLVAIVITVDFLHMRFTKDAFHYSVDQSAIMAERAQEHVIMGDDAGALALITLALETTTQPRAAYFGIRADILSRHEDFDNAATDYAHAITLDPENEMWYSGLCRSQIELDEFAAAEATCTLGLLYSPDNFVLLNNRCLARVELGDGEAALTDCNAALDMGGVHPYIYHNRARASLLLSDWHTAITDADTALDMGHDMPQLPLTTRGIAELEAGDWQSAQMSFVNALQMNPHHAGAYLGLGRAYDAGTSSNAQALSAYCAYLAQAGAAAQGYAIDRVIELGGCS